METMSRISELQPMSQDTMSILDRAGSSGNSTISRPVEVKPPTGERSKCRYSATTVQDIGRVPGCQSPQGPSRLRGHSTCVVQGSEYPELIHGVEHVVLRGWVHEVELQQVLDSQGLEQQHHVGQVGPLDLGHRSGQELIFVGALRVESAREKTHAAVPTTTRPGPASQTCLATYMGITSAEDQHSASHGTCTAQQSGQMKVTGRKEKLLVYSPTTPCSLNHKFPPIQTQSCQVTLLLESYTPVSFLEPMSLGI